MTLKELYEQHPEWHDLELVVYRDGDYDWVGRSADVYRDDVVTMKADDDPTPVLYPVLVFAAN